MRKYSKEEFLHIISGLYSEQFSVNRIPHDKNSLLQLIRTDKLEKILIPCFSINSSNYVSQYIGTSGHWEFSFISGEFVQTGRFGRCS